MTDDPRAEKVARAIEAARHDYEPQDWEPSERDIRVARAVLSILDNERIATRSDEDIARLFHETYERLAPEFGYETRKASAKPWSEVPENNRKLMIAVAGVVRSRLATPSNEALLREALEALRPFAESIVIDPTKQRGERHWATCGKLTNFEDQLHAHNTVAKIDAALNPQGVE